MTLPRKFPISRNKAARKAGDTKLRTSMRRSRAKMTPIRKSAKGEECTMRVSGVCNYDPATTVWAHSNRLEDGKGMGIKARDEEGCYACSACHAWLDGGWTREPTMTVELVQAYFHAARNESQEILKRKGLM